jgi:hypothetical protein
VTPLNKYVILIYFIFYINVTRSLMLILFISKHDKKKLWIYIFFLLGCLKKNDIHLDVKIIGRKLMQKKNPIMYFFFSSGSVTFLLHANTHPQTFQASLTFFWVISTKDFPSVIVIIKKELELSLIVIMI